MEMGTRGQGTQKRKQVYPKGLISLGQRESGVISEQEAQRLTCPAWGARFESSCSAARPCLCPPHPVPHPPGQGRAGQGRLIQPPPEPSQHPEQAAEPDQTEGSARPPPKLTLAPSQLPAAKFQRWLCWMEKQKQDGRKDARLLCHLSLSRHLPRSRQCIPLPLLVLFEHGEQWGRRGAEPSS